VSEVPADFQQPRKLWAPSGACLHQCSRRKRLTSAVRTTRIHRAFSLFLLSLHGQRLSLSPLQLQDLLVSLAGRYRKLKLVGCYRRLCTLAMLSVELAKRLGNLGTTTSPPISHSRSSPHHCLLSERLRMPVRRNRIKALSDHGIRLL